MLPFNFFQAAWDESENVPWKDLFFDNNLINSSAAITTYYVINQEKHEYWNPFSNSGSIAVLAWKSGNMLLKEIKYLTEEKEEKKKNAVTTKKNLRM